jgi:hypothetical protein
VVDEEKGVSAEGRLVAKRLMPDDSLQITVALGEGRVIRGVVRPTRGMRVPMEGTPVRIRGERLWDTRRGGVVEIDEVVALTRGRMEGRERRELIVERREMRPVPLPPPEFGPVLF